MGNVELNLFSVQYIPGGICAHSKLNVCFLPATLLLKILNLLDDTESLM